MTDGCLFCEIIAGRVPAHVVYEDEVSFCFLDHRPLFPGHVLLAPRVHVETLPDLPAAQVAPLFATSQTLCVAIEEALGAEGTFVAVNNRVSQSVPHLHVHVVPRRRKDGLRGFFWPRGKYRDDTDAEVIRKSLSDAVHRAKTRKGI